MDHLRTNSLLLLYFHCIMPTRNYKLGILLRVERMLLKVSQSCKYCSFAGGQFHVSKYSPVIANLNTNRLMTCSWALELNHN